MQTFPNPKENGHLRPLRGCDSAVEGKAQAEEEENPKATGLDVVAEAWAFPQSQSSYIDTLRSVRLSPPFFLCRSGLRCFGAIRVFYLSFFLFSSSSFSSSSSSSSSSSIFCAALNVCFLHGRRKINNIFALIGREGELVGHQSKFVFLRLCYRTDRESDFPPRNSAKERERREREERERERLHSQRRDRKEGRA